ncbi:MAG TPA: hypothetical protein PLV42_11265 [bacterium]|nr:hypothetical protein [bacterium]
MRIITVHHLIKGGRTLLIDRVPLRSRAAVLLTNCSAISPQKRVGITITTPAIAAELGIVRYLPLGGPVSAGPFAIEPAWMGAQAVNPLIDGRYYYLSVLPDMPYRGGDEAILLFPACDRPTAAAVGAFKRFVRESRFSSVFASGVYAGEWRRLCASQFAVELKEGPAQALITW